MSLDFLVWIAGILFTIIIVGGGILIYRSSKGLDEPENEPILHNFMLQYMPFREGIIKKMEIGEERIKIIAFPRTDINWIRAKNDKEYLKLLNKYTLYYDKRQVESQSGDASPNRTIVKAYPNSIDLLTEGLKNTTEGKAIMNVINKNNQLKDESELMELRMKNLEVIARKTAGEEIVKDAISKSKELMKDLKEETGQKDVTSTSKHK